jgi:hypothetical protein
MSIGLLFLLVGLIVALLVAPVIGVVLVCAGVALVALGY